MDQNKKSQGSDVIGKLTPSILPVLHSIIKKNTKSLHVPKKQK